MVSWEPRPLHVAVPYPSLPSSLSFPGHAWLAGSHAEQLETAWGGGWCCGLCSWCSWMAQKGPASLQTQELSTSRGVCIQVKDPQMPSP